MVNGQSRPLTIYHYYLSVFLRSARGRFGGFRVGGRVGARLGGGRRAAAAATARAVVGRAGRVRVARCPFALPVGGGLLLLNHAAAPLEDCTLLDYQARRLDVAVNLGGAAQLQPLAGVDVAVDGPVDGGHRHLYVGVNLPVVADD